MVLTLFALLLIAIGGGALTYLFADDETMLWRFSAGSVIGSALFGTLLFALAMAAGFSVPVILLAFVLACSPILLLRRADIRKKFERERSRAKSKFQGTGFKKLYRLGFYALFFVLFVLFFERAMVVTDAGIFTGGSNNFGDLPFHLGAIFSFSEGANFPPQNPSFAGAKFSYPFICDLTAAAFVKLSASVKDVMLVQNVVWAMSLLVVFERFVLKVLNDRLASKLAPWLLFLSGGLGFIWFFGDHFGQAKGIWEFLNSLPKDYTIGDEFRWGNSLTTLFLTQRSILLGMPITIVVLSFLYECFASGDAEPAELQRYCIVGLVAGMLPLVHLHSLFVLFIVGIFVLLARYQHWRAWLVFAAGTAVIAVPELVWSMAGSASDARDFIAFHFGWDSRGQNFVWFWLKNLGLFLPMLAFGFWVIYASLDRKTKAAEHIPGKPKKGKQAKKKSAETPVEQPETIRPFLLFYIPFAAVFVLANVFRFAPWEWDNIKLLIYWYVASIPFAAAALSFLFKQGNIGRAVSALCFIALVFAGSLDVWRTASGQIDIRVFSPDDIMIAERINARTATDSVILNAPIHNTAVALSGRISVIRYPGHLHSHGIDYRSRETGVLNIYKGAPGADELLVRYGVDYVLFGEAERNISGANEAFFQKFNVIAEEGSAKLYKIR